LVLGEVGKNLYSPSAKVINKLTLTIWDDVKLTTIASSTQLIPT